MIGADRRRADSLKVVYRQSDVAVDLSVAGEPLLGGSIVTELAVDGRCCVPRGKWDPVCWHSDDDGDYLELQLCLAGSLRIDRQFFLSRRDHFALLADAVIAPGAGRVEHRLRLPLASGLLHESDVPTREWRLGKARAFPLWLPQDRVLSAAGDCCPNDGRLDLTYTVGGPGLYLPLFFDWHPRRRRAAVDWKSLTVTEPGRVISPSGAAGHRLRLGKDQLLIFRGLATSQEPRAVLGQHTWYETVIARFDSDGDLDPLMLTEAE